MRKTKSMPAPAKTSARTVVTREAASDGDPSWLLQAAILFALALAVRGLHFLEMRNSPLFDVLICDAWQYDDWAQRIAAGDWQGGNDIFYQTPLYPYCLAVLYVVFGHGVWLVRGCQAVLGSLACVFLARAGACFFSRKVGWVAGALLALYPPAIFFDGIVQKASLDLALMSALVWVVGAAQLRPRVALFAAAGALSGAATLNRENAAILVPVMLAWIVWLSWSAPVAARWWRGLAFCGAMAAVLLPVGWRNYHVGGAFLLTTSQLGPNFYIGNHAGASGAYESLRPTRGDPLHESQDARQLAEEALARPLSASEVSRYWLASSWTDIRDDPAAWLRLLAWKWFLTWNTLELVDGEGIRAHQDYSHLLGALGWVLHFGILCPLAALGLWWTRRDWRRLWLLYAMLVAYAAAVTLFYVFARYRYPLVPITALFASAGLVGLAERLRARDRASLRDLAAALPLATVVAVACNWPLAYLHKDALTYFNVGTMLLNEGRPAAGIAMLKLAERIDPSFAATYHCLGLAALAEGDVVEAQRDFEEAIRRDPNLAISHVMLAEILEKQDAQSAAAEHLHRAIAIDPLLVSAYRMLARIELAEGDGDAAIEHLRRGVDLDSGSARPRAGLGMILLSQGHVAEAVVELRAAVKLDPELTEVANTLASILATAPDDAVRNGGEALSLAQRVCRQSGDRNPEFLGTLAAAHAELGQFDEAVKTCGRAIDLARARGDLELFKLLETRQQLLLQGKAFRDPVLQGRAATRP
jgi:tetratricopeptide (TPR) repeat protein